jgi:hypothetical protein
VGRMLNNVLTHTLSVTYGFILSYNLYDYAQYRYETPMSWYVPHGKNFQTYNYCISIPIYMWLLWIVTAISCAYVDYCSLIGQVSMHARIYSMRCSIDLLVCPAYVLAASRAPMHVIFLWIVISTLFTSMKYSALNG